MSYPTPALTMRKALLNALCWHVLRGCALSTHLHTGQQGAWRSVPAPPSRRVSAPPNMSLTLPILAHAHAGHCWRRHAGCWRCESSSTLPQTTPSSPTQLAHIRTSASCCVRPTLVPTAAHLRSSASTLSCHTPNCCVNLVVTDMRACVFLCRGAAAGGHQHSQQARDRVWATVSFRAQHTHTHHTQQHSTQNSCLPA